MSQQENIPSVWKNKEFISFIFLRFSLIFALFIQSTSVAFEIFRLTKKELFLGLIGLFEFAPILFTAFYAGQLVDKLDKRKVIIRCIASFMLSSFVLLIVNFPNIREQIGITSYLVASYFAFFILGLTRAFSGPAVFSLLAVVVRKRTTKKQSP